MAKLTKRTVDAAAPAAGEYFVWCSGTHGFGVRVYPSGKKVFVAQVRVGRATRRVKIGQYGPFTVDQPPQLIGKRPVQPLSAEPAFGPEDERTQQVEPPVWCDVIRNPARGLALPQQEGLQRVAPLARIDVVGPARHIADHRLQWHRVIHDLAADLWSLIGEQDQEGTKCLSGLAEALAGDLYERRRILTLPEKIKGRAGIAPAPKQMS